MATVNLYKTPVASTATADGPHLYGPDPYDINFAFPVHTESLETERVQLTPFVPAIHAAIYWKHVEANMRSLFRYYYSVSHATLHEFLSYLETIRNNPEDLFFAIIDKTHPDAENPGFGGSLAGVMALRAASPAQLRAEIAFMLVFNEFQRMHVASTAVGILLRYCLELPSANPPGLGLRRVQWCTHPGNAPSIRLATKMGFKQEGLLKWLWVLPEALSGGGATPRDGDPHATRDGQDIVVLAMYWDIWESGGRANVRKIIDQ
ncbi:hypothetical protein AcW1_003177 [Taiwanofungus camphoratus]|nr:hypothetical protein AcV5_001634 [Antrodia cinnamomea]KAI0922333.1 hypothetical protein AcV7_005889 [Antrodia cinnamomea]KAI0942589.1 hypothetical protein AcW1_003177 [Antrodia cinnamomea]